MGMSVKFLSDNTVFPLLNAEALGISKWQNGIKLIMSGGSFDNIQNRFSSPGEYRLIDEDGPEPVISLTEFCILHEITYSEGKFYITMAQKTAEQQIEELKAKVTLLNAEITTSQSEEAAQ